MKLTRRAATSALTVLAISSMTCATQTVAYAALSATTSQTLAGTVPVTDPLYVREHQSHLTGTASACLDEATRAWDATWTMTADGFQVRYAGDLQAGGAFTNEDLGAKLTGVSDVAAAPATETDPALMAGFVVGAQFATVSGPPDLTMAHTLTGVAHHHGSDPVTQTVTYHVGSLANNVIDPAFPDVLEVLTYPEGSLSVTIDSPCLPPTVVPPVTPPVTPPVAPPVDPPVVVPSTVPAGSGRFVALTPDRLLDTRTTGRIVADATVQVPVLGHGGVPTTSVTAVVLNITAVDATDAGFLTVFPSGIERPVASNLNVSKGQTAPNLVTVPVGADGSVSVFTSGGAHVLADVMGYYEAVGAAVTAGRFVALAPGRLLDTRTWEAAPVANDQIEISPLGHLGIPADGVEALVLNVTATGAAAAGFVTVYPTGVAKPNTSNLNLGHVDETRANQVIVKLGAKGSITLESDHGTNLLVDVAGYFTSATSGSASTSGLFVPVVPGRTLDTRSGTKPVAGTALAVQMAGRFGLPASGVAAVAMNATAVEGTTADFVTTWPEQLAMPADTSTLNVDVIGQTVPNHATSSVSDRGAVSIFTHGGAHLLIDVLGWYTN